MTRDRVENALRRAHSDALWNADVDVFEPTVSYDQGDGFDVSYPGWPDAPDATVEARVESPEADAYRQRSGLREEIDLIVRVRDDTDQEWTGFGDEQEAPAHIGVDGVRYEIRSDVDRRDGLLELEATEL